MNMPAHPCKLIADAGTIAFLLGLVACTSLPRQQLGPEATTCSEPRPQICTMDYTPVCATRDNEIRCVTTPCDSTEAATYANACGACADNRVSSYQPGECPS